jgi:DNA-directed RNA polymerase specialized sigma24 family protein
VAPGYTETDAAVGMVNEIAERTGVALGTVKTRIRLAMQKLRQRLESLREEDL